MIQHAKILKSWCLHAECLNLIYYEVLRQLKHNSNKQFELKAGIKVPGQLNDIKMNDTIRVYVCNEYNNGVKEVADNLCESGAFLVQGIRGSIIQSLRQSAGIGQSTVGVRQSVLFRSNLLTSQCAILSTNAISISTLNRRGTRNEVDLLLLSASHVTCVDFW